MNAIVFALLIGSSSALRLSAYSQKSSAEADSEHEGKMCVFHDPVSKAVYCYEITADVNTAMAYFYADYCIKEDGFMPFLKKNGHYDFVPKDSEPFVMDCSEGATCSKYGYKTQIVERDPYYEMTIAVFKKSKSTADPPFELIKEWVKDQCASGKKMFCHPYFEC